MALPRMLVNGDFEEPKLPDGSGLEFFVDASKPDDPKHVPGWFTMPTDPAAVPDHTIEIWRSGHEAIPAASGNQFAELNAHQVSTLYQDLETDPGTTMYWRLSHRGRTGADTMVLRIGAPNALIDQRRMTDDNTAWRHYQGAYTVPAGQTTTRFAFASIPMQDDSSTIGNLVDSAITAVKSATIGNVLGPTTVAADHSATIGNLLDSVVFTIPDELPSIFPEKDMVMEPPDVGNQPMMILHHTSGCYISTDGWWPVVGQKVQIYHDFPTYSSKAVGGHNLENCKWVLEKSGDAYRIRTAAGDGNGDLLYLQASKDTPKGSASAYPTQEKPTGDDLQLWTLRSVAGDPMTCAIVPKTFPEYALAVYGNAAASTTSLLVCSPTWGNPTFHHYWRLQPMPTATT